MTIRDWALLIIPNTAFIGMIAVVAVGFWFDYRDRKDAESERDANE